MIRFITDEEVKKDLTFGDVEEDQFFVSMGGRLCQKTSSTEYHIIANCNGTPCSIGTYHVPNDPEIKRILPKVTKIEF